MKKKLWWVVLVFKGSRIYRNLRQWRALRVSWEWPTISAILLQVYLPITIYLIIGQFSEKSRYESRRSTTIHRCKYESNRWGLNASSRWEGTVMWVCLIHFIWAGLEAVTGAIYLRILCKAIGPISTWTSIHRSNGSKELGFRKELEPMAQEAMWWHDIEN